MAGKPPHRPKRNAGRPLSQSRLRRNCSRRAFEERAHLEGMARMLEALPAPSRVLRHVPKEEVTPCVWCYYKRLEQVWKVLRRKAEGNRPAFRRTSKQGLSMTVLKALAFDAKGSRRFCVADEVGLGKTVVARTGPRNLKLTRSRRSILRDLWPKQWPSESQSLVANIPPCRWRIVYRYWQRHPDVHRNSTFCPHSAHKFLMCPVDARPCRRECL